MKLWPALVFACVLACVTGARAQTFPTRPITLVVPYAAGGNVDAMNALGSLHLNGLGVKPDAPAARRWF